MNSAEFWLSLAMIVAGCGAVWALFQFGKTLAEQELEYWFEKLWRVRINDTQRQVDRQTALEEFSNIYRSYLRERNDFWDKYGQVLVAIIVAVILAVLLLMNAISPEVGSVIFNPVVQMAALKQPFYYARFPALSLG